MCIVTSFDTLPLDVDFGHLLNGSNFSECHRGGGVGGWDDRKNDQDNGGGVGQGQVQGRGQAWVWGQSRKHILQRALPPRPRL